MQQKSFECYKYIRKCPLTENSRNEHAIFTKEYLNKNIFSEKIYGIKSRYLI